MASKTLAFDFASVRSIDVDGRLHVSIANISREQVAPYMGSEIPDYDKLGLDPNKIYQLYRPGEELEKAAKTFNLIPLMSEHIAVSAANPEKDKVVGSTGTDAVYEAPYLKNSLVVTDAKAIEAIQSGKQRELSCGYYYKPVLEDGVFQGQPYQIRMVDIIANHLALVEKGRAGASVVVGDKAVKHVVSKPTGANSMSKQSLSKKAVLAKGALLAFLRPKMAADAAVDLNAVLAGVKRKNWLEKKPGIIAAIKPHLANDADLQDVVALLDKLDGEAPDDDNIAQDDPTDPKCEQVLGLLRGKISDDDLEQVKAMLAAPAAAPQATDEPDPDTPPAANDEPPQTANGANADPKNQDNKDPIPSKGAMDSASVQKAITLAVDAARKQTAKEVETSTIARLRGIASAEEEVKPYVGKIVAQDSADSVYKAALEMLKVDVKDVHPSAYRHILLAQPKPGSEHKPRVAQDSAAPTSEMFEAFPNAGRLGR